MASSHARQTSGKCCTVSTCISQTHTIQIQVFFFFFFFFFLSHNPYEPLSPVNSDGVDFCLPCPIRLSAIGQLSLAIPPWLVEMTNVESWEVEAQYSDRVIWLWKHRAVDSIAPLVIAWNDLRCTRLYHCHCLAVYCCFIIVFIHYFPVHSLSGCWAASLLIQELSYRKEIARQLHKH